MKPWMISQPRGKLPDTHRARSWSLKHCRMIYFDGSHMYANLWNPSPHITAKPGNFIGIDIFMGSFMKMLRSVVKHESAL